MNDWVPHRVTSLVSMFSNRPPGRSRRLAARIMWTHYKPFFGPFLVGKFVCCSTYRYYYLKIYRSFITQIASCRYPQPTALCAMDALDPAACAAQPRT